MNGVKSNVFDMRIYAPQQSTRQLKPVNYLEFFRILAKCCGRNLSSEIENDSKGIMWCWPIAYNKRIVIKWIKSSNGAIWCTHSIRWSRKEKKKIRQLIRIETWLELGLIYCMRVYHLMPSCRDIDTIFLYHLMYILRYINHIWSSICHLPILTSLTDWNSHQVKWGQPHSIPSNQLKINWVYVPLKEIS